MYSKERLQQLSTQKLFRISVLVSQIKNELSLQEDLFLPDSAREGFTRSVNVKLLELKELCIWLIEHNIDVSREAQKLIGSTLN